MRKLPMFVPIGVLTLLAATATGTATGGCKKGLSDKEIRRIVRDEVQEQLRERKRRKASRTPAMRSPAATAADSARGGVRPDGPGQPATDRKERRVERLRRRILTLESLVARFSKVPSVSKKRVTMMKKQLAHMREQLARAEGGQSGLGTKTPTSTPTPPVTGVQKRKDWQDALAAGIRRLGKQRWELDRRILASVLKDPGFAATDATMVPRMVAGKPRGFKLKSVRPKGIFSALGLKTGDVVERVNNIPLASLKKARAILKGLSKARLVTLVLRRGGRRIVHVYTIKRASTK